MRFLTALIRVLPYVVLLGIAALITLGILEVYAIALERLAQ